MSIKENTNPEGKNNIFDLIDFLPDATFIIDKNHKVIEWNKEMEIMTGVEKDKIIGKKYQEYSLIFYKKQQPMLADTVLNRKSKKNFYKEKYLPNLRNGKGAYAWGKASLLYDNQKNIVGAIESIRDITEKKEFDKKIKDSERKYREFTDSLPQTVFEATPEGKIIFINSVAEDQFGFKKEDILKGMSVFQFVDPNEIELAKKLFKKRMEGKPMTYTVFNAIKKNKEKIPVIIYSSPVHNEKKEVVGLRGVIVDISQQKQYEEKLKNSEEKYQSLFDLSPEAVGIIKNRRIIEANKMMLKILGADSFKKIKNRDILDFVDQMSKNSLINRIKEIVKNEESMPLVETKLITLEGKTLNIEITASLIKSLNEKFIQVIFKDITPAKKLEEGLQKLYFESSLERQKIEVVMNSMGDGVIALNRNKKIIFANPVAAKLSGFKKEEMMGKTYNEVFKFVTEKDNKKELTFVDEVYESGNTLDIGDQALLINKLDEIIPVSDSAAPILDSEMNVVGCVIIFRDVTKERKIDKAKSEFVSVASHQLRTPLSAIKWFLELLNSGTSGQLSDEQKNYVSQIVASNERMIRLVNELLNVSRIETGNLVIRQKNLNLNELINNVYQEILPKILEKKQKLILKIDEPVIVFSDAILLRQVIENLITNANRYSPPGGTIIVKTYKRGTWAIFEVKDNGYGIPENQKEKLFTKFFRAENIITKQTDGTGLGLYVAKSAIETLGGKIWFESKENVGSTFYFSLPLNNQLSKE